jgi:hypothetical protein
MRYALLIYDSEAANMQKSEQEQQALFQDYYAFEGWLTQRGGKLGGEALEATHTATTVRVRSGKTVTTDGPFAETKEQLGGFYLLNANNLDEAIEVAARIPAAKSGSIEIRPIWEVPAQGHSH